MDLALAIWMINPLSTYTLNADKTAILQWRDTINPQPSQGELDAAWAAYQAAELGSLTLETDKAEITGDDVDAATVTLTFGFPSPSILILSINAQLFDLDLSPTANVGEQSGTIEITSPSVGATLTVSLTIFTPAGNSHQAQIEIEVI